MHALTFSRFGPPDVLKYRDVSEPSPSPGHAIVRLQAIGLNFADIYRRQGRYHLLGDPPFIAGYEGAGTIEWADTGSPFPAGAPAPSPRISPTTTPSANTPRWASPLPLSDWLRDCEQRLRQLQLAALRLAWLRQADSYPSR
jgi:NADPH:quinone reductase